MNKLTILTKLTIVFYILIAGIQFTSAQEYVPFTPRLAGGNLEIRGDIVFVGNNILNRASEVNPGEANTPYDGTENNNSLWMEYIDIDSDPSTFSSSSAELNLADPSCSQVRYAGLYWAGTYPNERSTDGGAQFNGTTRSEEWNEIKFRVPGGAYVDLVADDNPDVVGQEDDIIMNGYQPGNPTAFAKDGPVICYKNVTDLVRSNTDPNGEYTAANVRATRGRRNGSSSAGWVMVIIYENPNESGKFISTFDGYASLSGSVGNVDVAVNGFRTLPAPFKVNARIGVGALEGDRGINNDRFFIEANSSGSGFTNLSTGLNPQNNFFNSTITTNGAEVSTRTPFGTNTLGTDLDLFDLDNQFDNVLPNDETGATLRFTSTGDGYGPFLATFSVEIIEPNIVLEKRVNTPGGTDITGAGVNLGQVLDYVLSFQNLGNDDADNYTIRDVLPVNVSPPDGRTDFIPSDFVLPDEDVTYVYDQVSKEVVFTIPNDLVEENDPAYSIRIRVQVAENCFDFIDACSDLIQNIAYSTYQGVDNSAMITDDPSVTDFSACGFTIPGATNFLLDDLADCNFQRTVELCGSSATLNAGDGFDSYVWYRDTNNNGDIDADDIEISDGDLDNDPSTISVTTTGTYIVDKIIADPCKGFKEIITVEPYGSGTIPNPIIEYYNLVNGDTDPFNDIAGEIVQCSVDNDLLPKLFLCGIDDTKLLQVNILDAQGIVWERLNEGSCDPSGDDCANKALTCAWGQPATGSNYTIDSEGQYRISVTYQNGCTSRFYFNVFQNTLDIQFNKEDIVCNEPGNITITNLGNGYGYQLVDAATNSILTPFSANNGPSFDFTSGENGTYIVEVTQLDNTGTPIDDACVFRTPEIGILDRNVTYAVTAEDATCSGLGSINIQINNAEPNYEYELRLDDGTNGGQGTLIDNETAQPDNNFTFTDLNAGDYIVIARTDDGCSHTEQVSIVNNNDLVIGARVSQHITCREGNILVDSGGGRTPHTYAIWSFVDNSGTTVTSYPTPQDIPSSEFQSSQIFDILDAGDYTFLVVDRNNCFSFSNTVTIEFRPAAEFDPTSVIDVACFGDSSGTIQFNLLDDNGYQLTFFLYDENNVEIATNGSGFFPNLPEGDYSVVINQRKGSASCDYTEDYTIAAPSNAISASSVLIQEYTCAQEAIIEAQNTIGGTAPYSYSIDGVNFIPDTTPNANRFENLTDGTYTVTVRDAAGCVFPTDPIEIDPLNEPSDLTFVATTPNCPSLTSDVTISVTDGNPTFVYEIVAPAADAFNNGNSNSFLGLDSGTYTFRVTDTKGCSIEENFTITPVNRINVNGQLDENVSCFGFSDGEITFSLTNFNTSFDYTITGPAMFVGTSETATSLPFTGLAAGTYEITVTDNETNCTDVATVLVEGPSAALGLTSNETQLTCLSDGNVALTANDGWGGYSFTLTNPDTTTFGTNSSGNFSGLNQSGIYTATVTDANGCQITDTFIIDSAVAPILEIVPNDICYEDANGLTLTANVTAGGDGNYEYSLNGGVFGTTNVFTGLAPGTYSINVRDGKDCTDSETITINPELSLTARAGNIDACSTSTNITITAAGGDGAYVYAVVGNGVTPTSGDFSATNPVSVSAAGDYDVYVRDKNGGTDFCEMAYDIAIVQDAPLTLSISNTDIQCSGESQATITIVASGGEAPYTYSITNGATYQSSNTFNNQPAGSYNIRVRDVNNCDILQTYTITEPFTLSASAAVTALVECNPSDGAEVRITNAQGGTAPYTYSFDGGGTYGTSATGFLLPGNHTLYVRDSRNCIFPMNITVDPQPTPPMLSASIDYECDGEGTVTITPSSTDFDYTYSIDGASNTPDTSNIFSNVGVGSHSISVDYISNSAPTESVLLLENFGTGPNTSIPEVDTDYYCYDPQNGTGTSCNPLDGRMTNSPNSRINDLEYSVTSNIVAPFGSWISPNDASLTPNGRYLAINVGDPGEDTVVYSKTDVEVIPNRNIEVSLAVINLVRDGTGLILPNIRVELVGTSGTVIAFGETGPITENFGVNDWRNLTIPLNPGANSTLDIVIRTIGTGTNGNDVAIDNIRASQTPEQCSGTVSIDVLIEDGYAFDGEITAFANETCNTSDDGMITFSIENFDTVTGFEYQVNGGGYSAVQTTSPIIITGLAAGNYSIDVRDVFDNVCAFTLTQTITEPSAVVINEILTQPTCIDDGSIVITGSGGTGGYFYQIEEPDTNIIGPQTGGTFTGLDQLGDYIITITDANGCSETKPFTIIAPVTPIASIDPTSDLCYSSSSAGSATIVVGASAGVTPYFYSINGGPELTSNTFTNLVPGNYTFTVTDSNGCTDDVLFIVEPQLTSSLVLTKDIDCTVSPDAELTLNISGGYAPYTYEVDIDGAGYSAYTGAFPYTTGTPGTYTFRITDDQGCVAISNAIIVTATINPIATATRIDPTCNGDSNGIIEINVDPNFGSSPYEISFESSVFTAQSVYPGLAAGTYTYTVRDSKSCTYTDTVTLTDPILFDANVVPTDVSCGPSGDIPGSIAITITSGGAPNFTYTLYDNLNNIVSVTGANPIVNTASTSVSFDGLAFGDYYVRVIDANGCEYYENPVRVLANPYLSVNSTVTADCATGGTVTLSSDGGSGDYTFTIFGTATGPNTENSGPDANEETATFEGLNTGQTYIFQVIDNVTSCSSYIEETIPSLSSIDVVSDPIVLDATCFGDTNGSIAFQIEGFDSAVTDINYEIRESLTNIPLGAAYSGTLNQPSGGPTATAVETINNIPPGDYVLFFRENTSPFCSNTYDFRILEPTAVTTSVVDQNDGHCNEDANVTVISSGGSGTYTYAFVEDGVSPVAGDYAASNYEELDPTTNTQWDVYTLDSSGCPGPQLDITIADNPAPVISGIVTNQCAVNEGDFIIEITLDTEGISPHTLSLNGGSFQSSTLTIAGTTHLFSNLSSGNYTIEVRDFNGCGNSIPLEIFPPTSITAEVTTQPTCTANDGEATITPYGGSGIYMFELFSGAVSVNGAPQASPIFIGLNPGTYTAFVYDQVLSGCDAQVDVNLEIPTMVSFTTDSTPVSCFGASDGTITATLNPGMDNPPYTYQLFDVTGLIPQSGIQNSSIFIGLAANDYVVRVFSGRACQADIPETVGSPLAITGVTANVVEFGCTAGNNPNNATIAITGMSGGSGTYVIYEFIDNNNTPVILTDDTQLQTGSNNIYIETNTTGGNYTINVYDDNGCAGSTITSIAPYDELFTASASITNAITCNPGNDGEITITVTSTINDASRFEYSIDNGTLYQVSNVFGGLAAGTHNFLVRHIDTGCIIPTSETIADPDTFTIDVVKTSDVICFGTNTGEVTFELIDATYPGGFDWEVFNTNGTPANFGDDTSVAIGNEPTTNGPTGIINLGAGNYYVSISQINNPACVNMESFTINGPSADITGTTSVEPITCVGNDGVIEVINVVGGWGGYTYFVGTAAPTVPGDYLGSPRFENLAIGTYEAWVRDSEGCERMIQNNINLMNPLPITATLQVNQENCINLQGELAVIGTTGGQNANYTYQLIKDGIDFGAPQNTTVFSGLGAGSYEVRISDQWSCTMTIGAEVLYEEMNLTTTVVKVIDCTINPGGEITLNVTGGSSNLRFDVTYPDGTTTDNNTTGIFTGLIQAGIYSFVVTDLDTTAPTCSKTLTESLDDKVDPVLLDATIVNVSCFGGSNGSIRANLDPVTNTNPIYQYELYDILDLVTPIAGPQTNPLFEGLSAGNYQVKVISNRGCEGVKNETVFEPTELLINAIATEFACAPDNSVNTATITVDVLDGVSTPGTSSGTSPYLYSIDNINFQTSHIFQIVDNGSIRNITVYVTDDEGCPATSTLVIQPLNTFTAVVSQNIAISCTNPEEVLVTLTDDGNLHNYTFELLPTGNPFGTQTAVTSTTATFDLIAVGNYTFRITDVDTGCYVDTASYEIASFDFIDVVATATTPVTCFGDGNGALEVNIAGYIGTYSYQVFDDAGNTVGGLVNTDTSVNPRPIGGLSGGNHYVQITETAVPFCTENSNTVTIVSPDRSLSAIVDTLGDPTCDNNQGEILIEPSGGYAPYDISMANTITGDTYIAIDVQAVSFSGLSAGNFDITVTDASGCVYTDTEVLNPATPITANATPLITDLACYGDTGAIVSANVTGGGSGSYEYQLNYYDAAGIAITATTGQQLSPNFNDLGVGIYSITVSDGWNCDMTTNTVEIREPSLVAALLLRTDPLTCATGGEFELSATGGSGNYEYSTDNSTFLPMISNPVGLPVTGTFPAGTYQYFVRDAVNGCEAIVSNAITEDPIIPLTLIIDDTAAFINCSGESTAVIYAGADGGLGNYQYELFTDASLALASRIAGPQAFGEFRDLAAGTYYVSVTSLDCTTLPEEVVIIEPIPLAYTEDIINSTCAGEDNGSITLTLSGGAGGYQYAISPNLNQFDTLNTFEDLAPGDYTIIAQDQNGCFEFLTYTITEPVMLSVSAIATPEICVDSQDGTITLAIIGGTAPYSTALNANNEADFLLDRINFTDMAAGNYLIFVRDANGCETSVVVDIEVGVNLNAIVEPVYECTGDTPNNYVNITLEDDSVLGEVLYALDTTDSSAMQLNPDFRNTSPGVHYIAIAHTNGCVQTVEFTIEAFEPLTLVLEQRRLNEITAIAEGGRPEYTYYFNDVNNGNDNTFYITRTDTYKVRVVDENGCESIASIFIEFIDIEIPNFFTPDGDGNNDFWIPRNMEQFPEILIKIFDRYGRVVSEQAYDSQGWDGKYHGNELPTGDYWYVVQLKGESDEREFVGHFTLYR